MDGPRHHQLDPAQRANRGGGARADPGRGRGDRQGHRQAAARLAQPGLSETVRTLDILAENGIEYCGNWVNDEQPYPMKVKTGAMMSMPYSIEINDIPAFLELNQARRNSAG